MMAELSSFRRHSIYYKMRVRGSIFARTWQIHCRRTQYRLPRLCPEDITFSFTLSTLPTTQYQRWNIRITTSTPRHQYHNIASQITITTALKAIKLSSTVHKAQTIQSVFHPWPTRIPNNPGTQHTMDGHNEQEPIDPVLVLFFAGLVLACFGAGKFLTGFMLR